MEMSPSPHIDQIVDTSINFSLFHLKFALLIVDFVIWVGGVVLNRKGINEWDEKGQSK
jgi:hypothetical protein